jgi:hypothetical protein
MKTNTLVIGAFALLSAQASLAVSVLLNVEAVHLDHFSGNVNTNFGSDTELPMKNLYTGNERPALLAWDMTSLPAGATITGVTLNLYKFDGGVSPPEPNNNFFLTTITSAWNENTVTWNNQPTRGAFLGGNAYTLEQINGPQGQLYTVSMAGLTSLVADWYANPANNHGVLLETEFFYAISLYLGTDDNANVALRPTVQIDFTPAAIPEPAATASILGLLVLTGAATSRGACLRRRA